MFVNDATLNLRSACSGHDQKFLDILCVWSRTTRSSLEVTSDTRDIVKDRTESIAPRSKRIILRELVFKQNLAVFDDHLEVDALAGVAEPAT